SDLNFFISHRRASPYGGKRPKGDRGAVSKIGVQYSLVSIKGSASEARFACFPSSRLPRLYGFPAIKN
ncbi:hypothetical protein, partial [uncultured Dialister sp.]|uniref:hypothetical protein n=1 Tax=uncultured Dialister sp. TaxID=278064 RepID=UPI00265F98EB